MAEDDTQYIVEIDGGAQPPETSHYVGEKMAEAAAKNHDYVVFSKQRTGGRGKKVIARWRKGEKLERGSGKGGR